MPIQAQTIKNEEAKAPQIGEIEAKRTAKAETKRSRRRAKVVTEAE